jgi:hypothetical protein
MTAMQQIETTVGEDHRLRQLARLVDDREQLIEAF